MAYRDISGVLHTGKGIGCTQHHEIGIHPQREKLADNVTVTLEICCIEHEQDYLAISELGQSFRWRFMNVELHAW